MTMTRCLKIFSKHSPAAFAGDPVGLNFLGRSKFALRQDFACGKMLGTPNSRRTEYRVVEVQEWIDDDDSLPENIQ